MSGLARLVRRNLSDALVVWPLAVALVGIALLFVQRGHPEWAVVTLLVTGVALVPPVVTRDARVAYPAEIVALVAVPVLLRLAGLFPGMTPFLAIGGVALLVAIALEAYTSLSFTPRFAVLVTIVTTMAFAGLWAIGSWLADLVLGTALVTGQRALMRDMAGAVATGLLAGGVFEAYLRHTERLAGLRPPDTHPSEPDAPRADPEERTVHRRHRLGVRGMQAFLAAITLTGLLRGNWKLSVNSAVPLSITFLPALLRREYNYPMDYWLAFWLTLAATLHTVGTLWLYDLVPVFDSVAHVVSASVVAVVGYAIARAAELHTDQVSFNPPFRVVFVLLFVLAAGVGWELLEFAVSQVAVGGDPILVQYGADDTAKDLVADCVGAVIVAVWSTDRLRGAVRVAGDFVDVLVTRD